MALKLNVTCASALRISLLLLLLAAIATACIFLPIEKILKDFLVWVKQDLGPWGPFVLAIAYIPLTVLMVPASVLSYLYISILFQLGGGYLFGLPVGFAADSIGATLGATAAFILGRTIGRSYVTSKLRNYPKFQSVAIAIKGSGFKIVLLLRLVPLLPFNVLNYLLSVTPVHVGEYMLASWLGMMPITFALVYVGTTLKDLSDVTHGWSEVSTIRLVFIVLGFGLSVIILVCITKVAKASLNKALTENAEIEAILTPSMLPILAESPLDLQKPLIIKIDPMREDDEKQVAM
ncbi:TVP38/TMEM64 family membrane protein slr0305-like isoform X1 [Juglans microcarpa x Juglans regia]|uniref:TVP38/TMEM64 family membrane protein slr0305-like isoform X1 n=1 Tax=Juglans microcarpa x Juglans regia TaxID=2249226 RepID=UPI001B7E6F22|nr:TVP38/TMEM64 family membrane protein slr0305-like isoform X1 [Juglans microcarpa x Juglans regia]